MTLSFSMDNFLICYGKPAMHKHRVDRYQQLRFTRNFNKLLWVVEQYWRRSPGVSQFNCRSLREATKCHFSFPQGFIRFLIAIILQLLPWWTLAPIFVIINTINLLDSIEKPFKVIPTDLLRLASLHMGFFGLTARITQIENRSGISSIRIFTNRILASRCIALIGADLNVLRIA